MKKTGIAVLVLLMAATFAIADEHGGPGGPGGPEGPGGAISVAPDGTAIITRAAANSTHAAPVAEIVAVRAPSPGPRHSHPRARTSSCPTRR